MSEKQKISRVEVYWHTVKYRTVVLYALIITAIVFACFYLVFPAVSNTVLQKLSQTFAEPESPASSPIARQ
ncbi:MAG TPA: hypothetical protein VIY69_09135, partial [Candidatus Acidoferrales bacterium]